MSFAAGNQCKVLVGSTDYSPYFNQADADAGVVALDATTFGKNSKVFIPGLTFGKVDLTGLWDPTIDGLLVANIATAAGQVFTVAPNTMAVGSVTKMLSARQVQYSESDPVGGLVGLKASAVADGALDSGVSLHDLTAETASSNSASVDNTAASTTGAVGHLHVSAFSGFTNIIVKIQDSADNSAWADVAGLTFTTTTAVGAERLEITGTVRRYVRSLWTKTGTGSATFAVALARR